MSDRLVLRQHRLGGSCRLRRIFCPKRAVRKMGNTSSIPTFSILSPGSKSHAESPCPIMRCCLKSRLLGNVDGICTPIVPLFCKTVGLSTGLPSIKKNVLIRLTQQIVIWREDFCSGHRRGGYRCPPRWSTGCSDEWYFVGHGTERSALGSPKGRAKGATAPVR